MLVSGMYGQWEARGCSRDGDEKGLLRLRASSQSCASQARTMNPATLCRCKGLNQGGFKRNVLGTLETFIE
eukprot:9490762-Pyramimonas_sp.AAC.1